jgi:hypothetical protein
VRGDAGATPGRDDCGTPDEGGGAGDDVSTVGTAADGAAGGGVDGGDTVGGLGDACLFLCFKTPKTATIAPTPARSKMIQ